MEIPSRRLPREPTEAARTPLTSGAERGGHWSPWPAGTELTLMRHGERFRKSSLTSSTSTCAATQWSHPSLLRQRPRVR